ncbi:MAG: phage holin family protein [Flavobacterium sp.]|jgi:putative membrane protein
MKYLIKLIITGIIVMILSKFLSGITVDDIYTSVLVAFVLSMLNTFLRPILIFFTFPVTFITLGLFLIVINAVIVLICDKLLNNFHVNGFLTAIIFSVLLSLSQSIIYRFSNLENK